MQVSATPMFCVTRTGVSTTPFRAQQTHDYAKINLKVASLSNNHGALLAGGMNRLNQPIEPQMLRLLSPLGVSFCIDKLPEPYDQQDIGLCVWEATTGAYQIKTYSLQNETCGVRFSETCGYYFDRCFQGRPLEDCGSDSQNAMYIIAINGVCRYELLPFTNAIVDANGAPIAPPYPDGLRDAANHKCPNASWAACETPEAVETALKSGDGRNPVIWGTEVSADIQSYVAGTILSAPDRTNIIGGHEMLVVGVQYDWTNLPEFAQGFPTPEGFVTGKRYWWIRNSWSKGYGYNGYILCDDAFLFNDTAKGSHFAFLRAA